MITAYAPINFGNIVAGSNAIPVTILGSYFYARFTGILVPLVSGLYTIGVNCQDGCNVFLGTQELVSNATGIDVAFSTLQYTRSTQQYLTAGIQYPIIIEWVVGVGGASVGYQLQLIWTPPASNTPVLIPAMVLTNDTASITGSLSGSWWNGTSALYYPNGESTIDFANTSHPNKTLDYIPDGLTRKLFGSTGNTPFVAGADNSIAIAPNGNIVSTDGSGNVQDSGIAVSAVSLASGALQRSGGTMTGTLNMNTAVGVIWNSDTSLARDGASGALFIGANGVGSTVSLRLGGAGATKGSLIFGQTTAYQTTVTGAATANWTLTLPPTAGTNTYVLQTDGSGNTSWVAQSGGTPLSVAGDLLYENSTPAPARLGIGSTGQVLTVVGGLPAWANSASGFSNPMTNEGDIIYENASLGPAALPIGSTGQVLTVAGGVPTWAASSGGSSIVPPYLALNFTPPVSTNFTWSNPNSYAETTLDKTGRMVVTIPAGSAGLALVQNTVLPSTPYTIDIGILATCPDNIDVCSIWLQNNAGAGVSWGSRVDAAVSGGAYGNWGMNRQAWTSVTAPGANTLTIQDGMNASISLVFARVTDDGTHRTFWWSKNGLDYIQVSQENTGTGITPTKCGIDFYTTTGNPLVCMIYHWLVTPSILPQNAA